MAACNYNLSKGCGYMTILGLKSVESRVINQKNDLQRPNLYLLATDEFGACGDDVNYTFTASSGELRIFGSGEIKRTPWSSLRKNIISIVIEDGVSNIVDFAFNECSNLKSISISNTVNAIKSFAFYKCSNLTSVIIPDSVKTIGNSAFAYCSSLLTINISSAVNSIGSNVFQYCTKLYEINVASDNQNYMSIEGVLYTKNTLILINCPGGKIGFFSIPVNVDSIQPYAFQYCISLTSIDVPDSAHQLEIAHLSTVPA